MRVGMLWFDNSEKRTVEQKVRLAMERYEAKYGISPAICYVHPSLLVGGIPTIATVEIRASNMVLPHHFWLGTEEELERRPAA